MSDGDRPAETAPRVITLRGRSGPRRVPPLLSPGEVARRLAALERQVEDALGAERVSPGRVRRALDAGETAIVFPEGREAVARPYAEAYRVGRFTRAGVLRLALEAGVPIVPVGIIGVDEVHPVLARLALPRVLSGLGGAALPVTPTLLPLPTKGRLFVGDPLYTALRHR